MLLTFVMIVSASCVTAYAKLADITTPYEDENGKYYFTYEQSGTYIMNLLDDLLPSLLQNGMDIHVYYKLIGITLIDEYIRPQSYDRLLGSINDLWNAGIISAANRLGLTGDLSDINVDCLANYTKRTDTNLWDYNCIYNLVHFLFDNRGVLVKIVNGTMDWGLLDNVIDLPEMLNDIGGYLANLIYTKLEELTGREEGAEGSGTTATTYDPKGSDVDGCLNDLLIWLFNTKVPELLHYEGDLGLGLNKVNVKTVSFYDLIHNVIEAALDNLVVPLLKDVLMDAFGIETSDAFPNGTEDQMNNTTMVMVLGLVEDLLDEAETKPDYSNCRYPGEKIETLLSWFFQGGMDQYILINEDGIAIQDAFIELLYKVARIGIPMLNGMGFGTLSKEMLHIDELSEKDANDEYIIPDSQCIAILLNMLFSNILQGYYCNPNAKTLSEIGAYCLASLCARICPDLNYMEQLEANYAEGTYYDINGHAVAPLPFTATYTVNGLDMSNNGAAYSRTYTIPYAAVDMGVTIGVYFLDGLITADFSQVPGPGTNATVRFEKFVKVLLDWVVDKYLPMFKDTYNLTTKYPTYEYIWKEIDEILFGLLPTSWLPANITDHTMGSEYTVQGQIGANGAGATFPLKMSGDLICGWLLGSVMDVDVQELVSLLQRNKSQGADLANPTLTVIIRLVDRVLYIAMGKYALLPSQGNRNAYTTPTSITSLGTGSSGLLNNSNLGGLLNHLIIALSGGNENSFTPYTKLEPLLRTALPLIMGSEYLKPYRNNILSPGQIKVSDLKALIATINTQGDTRIPYGVADVNEETVGTYYYLDSSYNLQTATLPGDYDPSETYYSEQYIVAQDIDKFTNSTTYNYGSGVFKAVQTYNQVTLNGSNYDPKATYCSSEFVTATVTETTNGRFYTAQDENAAVTLPDSYVEGTTYFTHPEVALGASDTGTYLVRTTTYSPVNLTGTGSAAYNPNKTYYKKAFTTVDFNYIDAYNPTTGRIAMGVYNPNGANGVGTYHSSISGQEFMVFRNQEDFPDALFTFNNFNDFIKDAEEFIGTYEGFLEDMKDAADEWKEYFAEDYDENHNVQNSKGPSTMYPWYSSTGAYDRRTAENGVQPGDFNNLQAIKDFIAIYGTSAFVTNAKPLEYLPTDCEAGTTDRQASIYQQWNKYVKQVVKYSNRLNEYYDGINYYLQTAEANRKSYSSTSTYSLRWVMETLCATAYNGGVNGYVDETTQTLVPTYTEKSWNTFKKAYDCAIDLLAQIQLNQASARTTQSMVTAVRSGLIKAFYGLTKAGDLADKTQLYTAIVLARRTLADPELDATYTAASINSLRSILANANALFESVVEADDQPVVDNQTARLNAAINGLVYLVAPSLEVDENYDGDLDIGDGYVVSGITYGFIYGIIEGAGLILDPNMFNVNGINSNLVNVISQTYGNGTGSYIQAKDNSNTTKFIYFAVLFGDVNGDARIDSTDKAYIQAYSIGAANTSLLDADTNGGAYLKAADVDGDGSVTASDAAGIGLVVNYEATISQASGITGSRIVMA